ncbi:MAG: hypothetical protein AAFY26_27710, partial [Cyanobacteria bacterium J06638_22]
ATTVEAVAKRLRVSNAEVVRMALRECWGDDLSGAPIPKAEQGVNGSPVQPVNLAAVRPAIRADVQAVKSSARLPSADDLFSRGA